MIPRTFRFDKYSFNPAKTLEQPGLESPPRTEATRSIQSELKQRQPQSDSSALKGRGDRFQGSEQLLTEYAKSPFKVHSLWKTGEEAALFQHPMRILVTYQNTPSGRKALGAALGIAKRLQCPLTIAEIIVSSESWELDEEEFEDQAEKLEQKMQALFKRFFDESYRKKYPPRIKVHADYSLAQGVIHLATEQKCGLIICGKDIQQADYRQPLASSNIHLISKSKIPILIWPEERDSLAIKNIMVPTDGSSSSYSAIAQAITLSKSFAADMYLFQLLETEQKESNSKVSEMMNTMDWKDVRHNLIREKGNIWTTVKTFCDEQSIDLIVMNTQLNAYASAPGRPSFTIEFLKRFTIPLLVLHSKG